MSVGTRWGVTPAHVTPASGLTLTVKTVRVSRRLPVLHLHVLVDMFSFNHELDKLPV